MDARAAGLCADCRHHKLVEAARSTFILCRLGLTDPAYPKYPRLPVPICAGYEPEPAAEAEARRPSTRGDKLSR